MEKQKAFANVPNDGSILVSNRVTQSPTENIFKHLSRGNYSETEIAIKFFLSAKKGIRPQSHVAELIMFMERSFKGKYMNGERSHYQRVMPTKSWRKGDTLSEKLTRCKDKETFKSRFDRIGTTAILSCEHFNNFQIENLDFKGGLYLRLIDTRRGSISRFFRNDLVVEAFIEAALDFWKTHQKIKRREKTGGFFIGNPDMANPTNPEVTYLENPKPLLYSEVESSKSSRRNNRTSLTLVHSSDTQEKNQDTFRGREEVDVPCDIEDAEEVNIPELVGLAASNAPNGRRAHPEANKQPHGGAAVFKLWRTSVLGRHPKKIITEKPPAKLLGQAAAFYKRFCEFLPASSLAHFFDYLLENWTSAAKRLKEAGVWQTSGDYPELPFLLEISDKALTWYKLEIELNKRLEKESIRSRCPPSTGAQKTANPARIPARKTTAPGRTFKGQCEESLEHQIAYLSRSNNNWDADLLNAYRMELQKLSIDQTASEFRITELLALSEEELKKCCS